MRNAIIPIIFLLLFIDFEIKSQIDTTLVSKNVLYFEGAGIGGYGSINYERLIFRKANLWVNTRVGLSTYNLKDYTAKFNPDIILPFAINGLYGNNHKIEFGIGQTISNSVSANYSTWQPERVTNFHANFTIGYRFQKKTEGLMFRCNYSPIIKYHKYYRHWGGISVGYSF
ncbi:MAG: hypothetical protein OEX22_02260 [Cyclobacteriaceae bacterium]|nr:hypothetical protein [Cyclobacteriaceae bacterium]